jgi:hypothetical protein
VRDIGSIPICVTKQQNYERTRIISV